MNRAPATLSPPSRAALLAAAVCAAAIATGARGQTCDPATSAVGAHLSHARDSFARRALECVECHAPACSPTPQAPVVFGALASTRGAQPRWDSSTRTCSGVYCHGATLAAPAGPMAWSYVDPAQARPPSEACAICHGYPPRSHAPGSTSCQACHAPSMLSDGTVDVAGGHHVDGNLDFTGGGSGFACNGCHGFPPPDAAHVAHFGLTDATAAYGDVSVLQDRYPDATPVSAPATYAFGCGNCHPIDSAKHRDGAVEVEVRDAAAPASSPKGRAAPSAAYDAGAKTCSGVYCHSSGQEAPAYATTPGWLSGAHVACDACHGNPPAYPSGGPGTATANSHLNLADDGYEFGHFLGMPGAWHSSKHGGSHHWGPGSDAAPITCQTCHSDTTDPANTGPSGFYYLDTTGNYALPGGDPYRVESGWQAEQQCGYCHGAGGAATGEGKVLPLRHVNGSRDVVFDRRPALPDLPWLPAAPNRPGAPYWITDPGYWLEFPAFVSWNGTTASFGLGASGYDPATKTCTNVACHVAEAQPVWGRPYLYFGQSSATCYTCHPSF